ncbi:hypothetical protein [Treponema zioleckii]|uniref:hypothetical protein n=1 Tax=Treponema zioleckii TaxID=331680 RepID=UPI00168AA674|nr:hypothetical protein [Treponema zioleckii]
MLLTAVMSAGSAKSGKKSKSEKKLFEQGLSLASLMKEKASSQTYRSMFVSNEEILNKIREISAGDVSKPTAVYKISGDASAFVQNSLGIFRLENEDLSPRVRNEFEKKFIFMIPAVLSNRVADSFGIAAISIIASTTAFDCDGLKENCLYIFTFEDAYPVAVGFEKCEDKAVIASATYVLDKNFISFFESTLSELKSFINLKMEKIQ